MKRIIIITLVLIVATAPAFADPASDFIADHNINSFVCGAAEITVQPEIVKGSYVYHLQNIDIVISADDNEIKSFSCVCFDDSGIGEFLAQCVTAFYDIGGVDSYVYCYDPLLSEFLSARAGRKTASNSSVPGVLFQVVKVDNPNRYIFIIVKVK